MTRVVAAELGHFQAMDVQPWQKTHRALLQDDQCLTDLLAGGPAWTVLDGDRVLALGGILDRGSGRGECWGWLANNLGAKMISVHRAGMRYITGASFRRLEMYVHERHWQGIRLAVRLGFRVERSADSELAVRLESWF